MRRFDCPVCGFYITEADKVWDEYQLKKDCPNCTLINSGYSNGTKSGKEFIGERAIRKNRLFAGLVIVLFSVSVLLFLSHTESYNGKGSVFFNILQTSVGAKGIVLLFIGLYFIFSGLRK